MSVSEPRRDSVKIGTINGHEYRLGSIVGLETEPTLEEVYEQMPRRPSMVEVTEQARRRRVSATELLLERRKSLFSNPYS